MMKTQQEKLKQQIVTLIKQAAAIRRCVVADCDIVQPSFTGDIQAAALGRIGCVVNDGALRQGQCTLAVDTSARGTGSRVV